jgi:catechol 2,3-dioxygenase-like lactoylglutathione lyase family enzyme
MNASSGYLTPLLGVADVERSLHFYGLLGFQTVDVEQGDGSLSWARAHCEGGALMFVRRNEPPLRDAFLLYLYTSDLPALRAQLIGAGVDVGPIESPGHMPSGEVELRDPDGYNIVIGHWPAQVHERWLASLEAKRAAGIIRDTPKADPKT